MNVNFKSKISLCLFLSLNKIRAEIIYVDVDSSLKRPSG